MFRLFLPFLLLTTIACSKKVINHQVEPTQNYSLEDLKNQKYQDFFDESYSLNYQKLLAFRTIGKDIPEGLERRSYYNVLALLEAFVGNYQSAIDINDLARLQPTDMMVFDSLGNMTKSIFYPEAAYSSFPDSLFGNNYHEHDYSDFVLNLDDSVKVFALNEAHTVTRSRNTLYASLEPLKKKGFKYLLLETLFIDMQDEHNNGLEAKQDLGFFSGEVTMGHIIRKAKGLGFTLVAYDAQGAASQAERELKSFENIIRQTFDKEPSAKIVLYAGHSHIAEARIGKIKNLGLQFNEFGINPLTIDQTRYYERNVPDKITKPTLFKHKSLNSRYDYLLVLPASTTENERPSWIWDGNRKSIKLSKKMLKFDAPFLIEAFARGASKNAVPIDRLEVTKFVMKKEDEKQCNTFPSLALKPGKYLIKLTSKENRIKTFDLEVN